MMMKLTDLNMIDNEIDGNFVFSTPGYDDVGMDHGRSDEDVECRFHVTIVLFKHSLEENRCTVKPEFTTTCLQRQTFLSPNLKF